MTKAAAELQLDEPCLPRQRRLPAKLDSSTSTTHQFGSPEEYFRSQFYNLVDTAAESIAQRFSQSSVDLYVNAERLLVNAANNSVPHDVFLQQLKPVCDHFTTDLDSNHLLVQL